MKLIYYKQANFGDALNLWMWQKLIPNIFDDDSSVAFMGLGTLLNESYQRRVQKANQKIIFSTGVGYGKILQLDSSYTIYCLRGPLSAQALQVPTELAITDGAILVRRLFKGDNHKKNQFAYMPHYELAGEGWNQVCKQLGFGYIDPRWSVEKVLEGISQTEILLAEAMHGAIIADALRIPWIPIVTNNTILNFKWQDWCQSLDLEYQPITIERLHHPRKKLDLLTPVRLIRDQIRQKNTAQQLSQITKTIHPTLSADHKIEELTLKLENKLQFFRNDLENGYFKI